MNIDIRTIIFLFFFVSLINVLFMAIIYHQYRRHFLGLFLLLIDMILQSLGILFILLRGVVPNILSIWVSNVFQITGALLVLIGLEQFFELKRAHKQNYIIMGVFILILAYFSLIDNNLFAREVSISAMIIIINIQSCYLLYYKLNTKFRHIARTSANALLAYVVISFIRIILLIIFQPQTSNFYQSGLVDSISMTLYLTLSIIIAMSFILLVSRRLLNEVLIEKEKYNKAFDSAPYAIILSRLSDGKIFEVNESFERISGYRSDEVINKTSTSINLWSKEEDRFNIVNLLLQGGEVKDLEIKFTHKTGNIVTGVLSSKMILVNDEKCIITSVGDITEMNEIKNTLHNLAMHDVLTGLPNRKLFYQQFEKEKLNATSKNHKMAVLSVDVDYLKSINDQYGHEIGDKVLIAIANRLVNNLSLDAIIARFGGDEFIAVLPNIIDKNDIKKVVATLNLMIAASMKIEGKIIEVTASIGIAIYPDDGTDINVLLKQSDQAMYRVKKSGRNGSQFYCDSKQ